MALLSRRELVTGAAALAAIGSPQHAAWAQKAPAASVALRILATSDIHMFVLDWDYYRAKPDPTVGLAKLADLIKTARAEAANSVLLDNGDFLQGNPLADLAVAQIKSDPAMRHPLIEIMGDLAFDAIGLGNHEFNYGLDALQAALRGAPFPVVCANVARTDGGDPIAVETTVLQRTVTDSDGRSQDLRIGIIGFVPPQIMIWDRARLQGRLSASDIVLTAQRLVPALRQSCDVLIALSHSGIRGGAWSEGQENASFHLAAVPGIDAIVTGHSHLVFPGPVFSGVAGVDAVAGTLQGVPAVMPGFWGSHLGIIDLTLRQEGPRWHVAGASTATRSIYRREGQQLVSLAQTDPSVVSRIRPAHEATLRWVEEPLGTTNVALHSFFVWAAFDPCTRLVNDAQLAYAQPFVAQQFPGLPILSAAAPFRTGYTPDSFVDIEPGPVSLRQIADIYIYSSNTVVAVKLKGAEVVEWLEAAARVFNRIELGKEDPQPLLDRRVPSYNFDVISGLDYDIDVSEPPRYDASGEIVNPSRRVRNVRFQGAPIDPEQDFIVVTNNYRGDGGGNFSVLKGGGKVVWRAPDSNRDAVAKYLKATSPLTPYPVAPWRFASLPQAAQVYFDTGLAAARHLPSMPNITPIGEQAGYLRVSMRIGS
jgi:2',3'-cyclic-nucleotide 2'-phosphodiesterase/3'-nucleotidase